MIRKFRFFVLGLILIGLLAPRAIARDSEVWLTFNLKEGSWGNFSTTTHTHYRFPTDDVFLRYYRVSQKIYYKIDDTWTLGLHPVWEQSRSREGAPWSDTVRFDFEVNPTWKWGATTVKMRNRFEIRFREGEGNRTFNRFRSEVSLKWKAQWLPGMTWVGVKNEIFYDFSADRWNTNWFYPLTLGFKITDHFNVSIGYQIASSYKASLDSWRHTDVVALGGDYAF